MQSAAADQADAGGERRLGGGICARRERVEMAVMPVGWGIGVLWVKVVKVCPACLCCGMFVLMIAEVSWKHRDHFASKI